MYAWDIRRLWFMWNSDAPWLLRAAFSNKQLGHQTEMQRFILQAEAATSYFLLLTLWTWPLVWLLKMKNKMSPMFKRSGWFCSHMRAWNITGMWHQCMYYCLPCHWFCWDSDVKYTWNASVVKVSWVILMIVDEIESVILECWHMCKCLITLIKG